MLKRNLAVLVLVGALLAGGAYAWAQTSDGSPSAPTTQPTSTPGPKAADQTPGQRGGRAGGILKRVVHGDLIVRGKDGFQNVTYDRGKEDGVSDNTLTITRPDGKKVSVKLTSETKYKGVKDASELQAGRPTLVVSKDGNALIVGQRSGDRSGGGAGGQQ